MVTININGLTLCHKGSGGISHNTLPDVCKTPPFGVPVPYENEAYSADLIKGTTSVFADGRNMIANVGSQFARSVFDEAGSMGGILSGTNMAETEWISHSFDVFFEKKPACRLTDKLFMNHRNTVNMAGELQAALDDSYQAFKDKICEWAKDCYIKNCGGKLGSKEEGAEFAHYQDCLNEKIEDDTYQEHKFNNGKKESYPCGDIAREVCFEKNNNGKWEPLYSDKKDGSWGINSETEGKMVSNKPVPKSGGRRLDILIKIKNRISQLLDIKFPKDGFAKGQREAYEEIAEDIGADFKPFYLNRECPDWPDCPNEEETELSPEELQEALENERERQLQAAQVGEETDWILVGLTIAAIAVTVCPFDGPIGDAAAWGAVASRAAQRKILTSAPAY
ncbi:hypothetical protein DL121_13345 [Salmonella enterica subsp. enterica]|nr:hypothetical protein [Salmonella enterica subsp. enterica]